MIAPASPSNQALAQTVQQQRKMMAPVCRCTAKRLSKAMLPEERSALSAGENSALMQDKMNEQASSCFDRIYGNGIPAKYANIKIGDKL